MFIARPGSNGRHTHYANATHTAYVTDTVGLARDTPEQKLLRYSPFDSNF